MNGWDRLADEIAAWRELGRTATLWWRDDDARTVGPNLDRLLELAGGSGVPLALAVIGGDADEGLGARLAGLRAGRDWVLVHGFRHIDHAPAGAKRSEFPDGRIVYEMLADVAISREALVALCGPRLLPIFVPPWNRIAEIFLPRLTHAYIRGLSRHGPRAQAAPAADILEVNTHVDPIDWRGDRGFIGEAAALGAIVRHLRDRREGRVDADEPTGILSHHAVMDEAGWRFLAELFERAAAMDGLGWLDAGEIFGSRP